MAKEKSTNHHVLAAKIKSTLNSVFKCTTSPLTHRWQDINTYQGFLDIYLDDVAKEAKDAIEKLESLLIEEEEIDELLVDAIALIKISGGVDAILTRRKKLFKFNKGDLMTAVDLIHYCSILNSIAVSVSLRGEIDPIGMLIRKVREKKEVIDVET